MRAKNRFVMCGAGERHERTNDRSEERHTYFCRRRRLPLDNIVGAKARAKERWGEIRGEDR